MQCKNGEGSMAWHASAGKVSHGRGGGGGGGGGGHQVRHAGLQYATDTACDMPFNTQPFLL